ncbi:MAG: 50S ribosomal protein L1 [Candidatus Bathyarchaeia archaeon]
MSVDITAIVGAIDAAKKDSKKRGFEQSIELIVVLQGIDLKKPENRINELVELPHPPGKEVRIGVFATGDMALRAKNAGVNVVMGRDDLEKMAGDKKTAKNLAKNTDYFIAEAPLMPLVGKSLGPILGPKGKMPTPVPPTAPMDAMVERLLRTVRIRMMDQPNIQCAVGTEDMPSERVAENVQAVITAIGRKVPGGMRSVRKAFIKTTMGPRVKIEL